MSDQHDHNINPLLPSAEVADPLHGTLMSDVETVPVKWMWWGRLAIGKITMLDGDPGVGKSTFYAYVAAAATLRRPWPEGDLCETPGAVVVVTAEDDPADTIRPRLEASGADLTEVRVLDVIEDSGGPRTVVLPRDTELVAGVCAEMGATLLVIDPLSAHLERSVDSHNDASVRSALAPLQEAARRHGFAVLLVRHLNKSGGSKAIYRGMGSIGVIGAARFGLIVAEDPTDPAPQGERRMVLATHKNNVSRWAPSLAFRIVDSPEHGAGVVEWEGPVELRADDLFEPVKRSSPVQDDAESFLAAALSTGPRPTKEVEAEAEGFGVSLTALRRARRSLRVECQRKGFGAEGAYYLSLPEDGDGAAPGLPMLAMSDPPQEGGRA
jgi:hypothetical protein